MTVSTTLAIATRGLRKQHTGVAPDTSPPGTRPPVSWRTLLALALVTLLGHLAIAGRYGWFRDELYYVDAGKHLAGGYVEFPAMVAVLADLQRALFGPSFAALHVLPCWPARSCCPTWPGSSGTTGPRSPSGATITTGRIPPPS